MEREREYQKDKRRIDPKKLSSSGYHRNEESQGITAYKRNNYINEGLRKEK